MKGLYYYKLQSPYSEDVTKNCKLTINEIDSNFLNLKNEDIKSAEFIREDKTLVLTQNDGDKLIVDLSDIAYDLNVSADTISESGASITISFDGKDGKENVTINNLVTVDNLMSIIGSDILTRVITDGTLKGHGTVGKPLGIAETEKTGSLAPALEKIDLTQGGMLPEVAALGTRYVTVEYVDNYGYLYNGLGLETIKERLAEEAKGKGLDVSEWWHVPTKEEWDALLDSVEPCEFRNHTSAKCHTKLGKYAGAYLKSACGWLCQPECECSITAPSTGCTTGCTPSGDTDYVEDDMETGIPQYDPESPNGVDKFGMNILPCGMSKYDATGDISAEGYKTYAFYWADSFVYGDSDQNRYVKKFVYNAGGVWQESECPDVYYSIRLVKKYDGENYFDTEYIDGLVYKTLLFPNSGQIWLATNYAQTNGFGSGTTEQNIAKVNNGEVPEKRKALFINEWNGVYWEKRMMNEGETIVIENPTFDASGEKTIEVSWVDAEGVTKTMSVKVPDEPQSNVEYRVFTEDGCNQDLYNTDDLVVERILKIVVPLLANQGDSLQRQIDEINEDIENMSGIVDTAIDEVNSRIDKEIQDRIDADELLNNLIEQETAERTEADEELSQRIDEEVERAQEAEKVLDEKIEAEIERATNREDEIEAKIDEAITDFTFSAETLNAKIEAETKRAQEAEAALDSKIEAETDRAEEAENALDEKIEAETERATQRENEIEGQQIDPSKSPYQFKAVANKGESNLVLESKDGNGENFVRIVFDGDFGQI